MNSLQNTQMTTFANNAGVVPYAYRNTDTNVPTNDTAFATIASFEPIPLSGIGGFTVQYKSQTQNKSWIHWYNNEINPDPGAPWTALITERGTYQIAFQFNAGGAPAPTSPFYFDFFIYDQTNTSVRTVRLLAPIATQIATGTSFIFTTAQVTDWPIHIQILLGGNPAANYTANFEFENFMTVTRMGDE